MPARRDVEDIIANLAARQHGVVSRSQLLAAGIGPDVIDRRLQTRRLRALHRAVYRVGPLVAPHAAEMAAVLACGHQAVISHQSAGVFWRLLPDGVRPAAVHISVPMHVRRQHAGIRLHRMSLGPDERTVLHNVPLTTAARTLVDLAPVIAERDLERPSRARLRIWRTYELSWRATGADPVSQDSLLSSLSARNPHEHARRQKRTSSA